MDETTNPAPGNIQISQELQALQERLEFSLKLQAVTNKIHATNDIDEIMVDLSLEICDLFHCERLTIYAVSKEKDQIYSKVKVGIDSKKNLTLPITDKSIAGYVALHKRVVLLNDVYDENALKEYTPELHFYSELDTILSFRTKQMLAAPLLNARNGELLGVIQLLNNAKNDNFKPCDIAGVKALSETLAIAFLQRLKPAPPHSKYDSLVTDSLISAAELELAGRWARRKSLDIEDALADEFQVPLRAIGEALAKNHGIPYEPHQPRIKPAKLLAKLSREFAEKNQALPYAEDQVGIAVMTTDPERPGILEALKEIFPYSRTFFRITTKREFKQTLDQFFG